MPWTRDKIDAELHELEARALQFAEEHFDEPGIWPEFSDFAGRIGENAAADDSEYVRMRLDSILNTVEHTGQGCILPNFDWLLTWDWKGADAEVLRAEVFEDASLLRKGEGFERSFRVWSSAAALSGGFLYRADHVNHPTRRYIQIARERKK